MAVKRLIETFVPENYKIFLDIDRKSKTFKGQVAIKGEAKAETIYFHQKDLNITKVSAFSVEADFTVDNANEELTVKVGQKGQVTVSFEYEGKITDNMMGIYPSYYEVNGEKKMLIGTQFESHFARQAFPSIDEPEAKATFDLSVKFDEEPGDIIISNMPELLNIEGIHVFERTVRMSSYLLAFVFGDMQYKKGRTKSGVEVGTFSTKAHSEDVLDFPLDIAIRSIEFYEDYYKTPYPLPHSWHVALPDFSAGAMENWGCITYREVCMLVDPENATVASKQYVATVIAHELAHQWFGDLVTMRWWDDLWLNESFANNMEYVAIDAIEPDWKVWESFSVKEASLALDRDATDGVQSVHVDVNHPDEIGTLFDAAIVYAKGSRLMVMLRKWLGDEDFSAGLRKYFETHQYGNTVGDDLWDALSSTSGKNVGEFMHSWVNQPGYPVLTAEVVDDTLILSQQQFFIGKGEDKGRLWQIPLNTNWKGLPDTLSEERIEIPNYSQLAAENKGALRLNTANTAHYITDYQGELLDQLLEEFANLDTVSKLQILQERRLLAESGRISYASLVALLDLVEKEESFLIAQAKSQILAGLKRFIDEDTEAEVHYKALVRRQFQNDFERLGFDAKDGESDEDEMVRQTALSYLIQADYQPAVLAAASVFQAHKENIESIPASVRGLVLINQMKQENSLTLVEDYVNAYVTTNDSNFRRQLTQAVSYLKNQEGLDYVLGQLKDKHVVKPQDLYLWYMNFLNKSFAQETVWNWAKDNWDWIKAALGGDMSFDSFVNIPAGIFKTQERLDQYIAFFEPQTSDKALERNILMGIKTIAARVNLIEKEKAAVESALKDY